jgi:hypothetical protein
MGATSLKGKPYSAKITLEDKQLVDLRNKHGRQLEEWRKSRFGHGFEPNLGSQKFYSIKYLSQL